MPFLKWAGGKRWLFTEDFIKNLPPFERYIEPFLGGGAGFFALQPDVSILSDVNRDLIDLYSVVQKFPRELQSKLKFHQKRHSSTYYYKIRGSSPRSEISKAAKLLYLNRTCWNGLYRLNKQGIFNVPVGTKTSVVLPTDDFAAASASLRQSELIACDFENTIDRAQKNDLLFVDPPYTVKHDANGFVKYNETIFSWADQIRLRAALYRASERGASIILTNANHISVKELYNGFGIHKVVDRASVISGKSAGRSNVSELMVRA